MDQSLLRTAPPAPRGGKPVREAIGFIRNAALCALDCLVVNMNRCAILKRTMA